METFGQSWLVADYTDGVNVSECKNNCHRPSPSDQCDPKKEQLAKYLCGKMEKDFYVSDNQTLYSAILRRVVIIPRVVRRIDLILFYLFF